MAGERDWNVDPSSLTVPPFAGPDDPAIVLGTDEVPAELVAFFAPDTVVGVIIARESSLRYQYLALVVQGSVPFLVFGGVREDGSVNSTLYTDSQLGGSGDITLGVNWDGSGPNLVHLEGPITQFGDYTVNIGALIEVFGDLDIKNGGDLTVASGGDLIVASGGEIIVQGGGILNVDSSGDITLDSGSDVSYDGESWVNRSSWTPVLTQTTTNPTAGFDSTTGRYSRQGDLVHFWITTTILDATKAGTGTLTWTLPFDAAHDTQAVAAYAHDVSGGVNGLWPCIARITSTGSGSVRMHAPTPGVVTQAVPFAVANGDVYIIEGSYYAV